MKLILVMVNSLDGRTTHGTESDNHTWTSPEDQEYFMDIIENASLLIMGSTTYEAARENMQHRRGQKRVVITRNPSKYEKEKLLGQLEFTSETPTQLLDRLEKEGYTEGYLLGGAHTNTEFFRQKIVTELWQTLEPKILGIGNGIVGEEEIDVSLELKTYEKLNEKGTLLLKYKVLQ